MKYMLLVYGSEREWDEPYREACYAESRELVNDIKAKGQFLATSPLQPTATAASVRIREGKRLVTDGPFAETREQLGGYYIVDVDSQDDAIEIASRIPGARTGTIEVRPVIELAGLPKA
jgi:hypothetical protein